MSLIECETRFFLTRSSMQAAKRCSNDQVQQLIVLDTDVLIRNDMDELFEKDAPVAVRRHPQGKYLD